MRADSSTSAIELAHEPPFAPGTLEMRPATLEVMAGSRCEVLEPRVMQVLVALARRRGEVVSRDELLQGCWGGRNVGEDAGFALLNVPRLGYRLDEASPHEAPGHG